jgi:hypothetical protein
MNWRVIRWALAGIAVVTEVAAFVMWRRHQHAAQPAA